VGNTTKSLQLAVVVEKEYLAGYWLGKSESVVPISMLQSLPWALFFPIRRRVRFHCWNL
jgi:hypothetical protein